MYKKIFLFIFNFFLIKIPQVHDTLQSACVRRHACQQILLVLISPTEKKSAARPSFNKSLSAKLAASLLLLI